MAMMKELTMLLAILAFAVAFPNMEGFGQSGASFNGRMPNFPAGMKNRMNSFTNWMNSDQCKLPPQPTRDVNAKAKTGAAPYTVTFTPPQGGVYGLNTPVQVTIKAKNNNRPFQGFFLSVKTQSPMPMVGETGGQWTCQTGGKSNKLCFAVGAMNVDTTPKRSITCTWTSPARFTVGDIHFTAAIVENPSSFWTTVDSGILKPDTTKKTMQQVFFEMMSSFSRNMGNMGNMGGGAGRGNFMEKIKALQNQFGGGQGGQFTGFGRQ